MNSYPVDFERAAGAARSRRAVAAARDLRDALLVEPYAAAHATDLVAKARAHAEVA